MVCTGLFSSLLVVASRVSNFLDKVFPYIIYICTITWNEFLNIFTFLTILTTSFLTCPAQSHFVLIPWTYYQPRTDTNITLDPCVVSPFCETVTVWTTHDIWYLTLVQTGLICRSLRYSRVHNSLLLKSGKSFSPHWHSAPRKAHDSIINLCRIYNCFSLRHCFLHPPPSPNTCSLLIHIEKVFNV